MEISKYLISESSGKSQKKFTIIDTKMAMTQTTERQERNRQANKQRESSFWSLSNEKVDAVDVPIVEVTMQSESSSKRDFRP